jgi:hypothetical protein
MPNGQTEKDTVRDAHSRRRTDVMIACGSPEKHLAPAQRKMGMDAGTVQE